jgi:hypothetical protein
MANHAGWCVKPIWGSISDRVPLFGFRRKSWFVLMVLLAVLFWSAEDVEEHQCLSPLALHCLKGKIHAHHA